MVHSTSNQLAISGCPSQLVVVCTLQRWVLATYLWLPPDNCIIIFGCSGRTDNHCVAHITCLTGKVMVLKFVLKWIIKLLFSNSSQIKIGLWWLEITFTLCEQNVVSRVKSCLILYTVLTLKYEVNLPNASVSCVLHQNARAILTATGSV